MPDFQQLVARLQKHYGKPESPPAKGPFELVLWENACYLLPDERRREVFEGLRDRVGLTAEAIWKADRDTLLALAKRGGMRPEMRVLRWREIARITLEQFEGNLDQILDWPYAEARGALRQFPNIGDPGAEKILVFCALVVCVRNHDVYDLCRRPLSHVRGSVQAAWFCGAANVRERLPGAQDNPHSARRTTLGAGLPLESNGVRVLTRVGYGRVEKAYGKTLRSVQDALAGQLPRDTGTLARAHLLLRQHGKETCRNNRPACGECPVVDLCGWVLKSARQSPRESGFRSGTSGP